MKRGEDDDGEANEEVQRVEEDREALVLVREVDGDVVLAPGVVQELKALERGGGRQAVLFDKGLDEAASVLEVVDVGAVEARAREELGEVGGHCAHLAVEVLVEVRLSQPLLLLGLVQPRFDPHVAQDEIGALGEMIPEAERVVTGGQNTRGRGSGSGAV